MTGDFTRMGLTDAMGKLREERETADRIEALEAEVKRLREALAIIRDLTYYKTITNKTEAWRLAHAIHQIARVALAEKGNEDE